MGKRPILLTIDDAEWNAFKARVALSGGSMAEVFRDFVRDYMARRPTVRVDDRPRLDAAKAVKETGDRMPEGMDKDLVRYARVFSIPVESEKGDSLKDSLKESVMDAIEKDFKEHRVLGGEEFHRYLDDNREMLVWFNDNRG